MLNELEGENRMIEYNDYSIIDTGMRFKGHPILLGSTKLGHKADKLALTQLDKFLKQHLSEDIVRLIINHSTGLIVNGAIE